MVPGENGERDRSFSWVSGTREPFTFTLKRDSIEVSFAPDFQEFDTEGGKTFVYNIHLKDLDQGQYHYYIVADNSTDTLRGSFRIKPRDGVLDFLLLGDIQDPVDTGTKEFLSEVASRFPDMDAWLFVGDMIERPHDEYWQLFYETVESIAPSTPFIPVAGNHEYNTGGFSTVGARYLRTFPMPQNGNKERLGANYYVDYPEVRIIGLDTNMIIRDIFSTRDWLKQTISSNKAPFTIILGHHGAYSVRKGRFNPIVWFGLKPIYTDCKVDLVLQGHDHAYSRNGGPESSYGERPVYITQTSSYKCYEVGSPKKHDKALSGERLYSHIRITADTLYYQAFREDHTLYDSLKLQKKQ